MSLGGEIPADWRGVPIAMGDIWGSYISGGRRGVLLGWVWRRRDAIDTCHS